jgi:hypothetical protein
MPVSFHIYDWVLDELDQSQTIKMAMILPGHLVGSRGVRLK